MTPSDMAQPLAAVAAALDGIGAPWFVGGSVASVERALGEAGILS
jgi:hypothetical protein